MQYHPLIGISIFLIAIILSFILGRKFMKKTKNEIFSSPKLDQNKLPKGDVTSPDAPWLNKNKN